jgi:hypothetical protein
MIQRAVVSQKGSVGAMKATWAPWERTCRALIQATRVLPLPTIALQQTFMGISHVQVFFPYFLQAGYLVGCSG